ncbi:MAG: hypothetical protein P4M14_02945 [Gammaproteobacteria bacterium]|nr:hypothetical protein [Gammaproteobacteria bacterium]
MLLIKFIKLRRILCLPDSNRDETSASILPQSIFSALNQIETIFLDQGRGNTQSAIKGAAHLRASIQDGGTNLFFQRIEAFLRDPQCKKELDKAELPLTDIEDALAFLSVMFQWMSNTEEKSEQPFLSSHEKEPTSKNQLVLFAKQFTEFNPENREMLFFLMEASATNPKLTAYLQKNDLSKIVKEAISKLGITAVKNLCLVLFNSPLLVHTEEILNVALKRGRMHLKSIHFICDAMVKSPATETGFQSELTYSLLTEVVCTLGEEQAETLWNTIFSKPHWIEHFFSLNTFAVRLNKDRVLIFIEEIKIESNWENFKNKIQKQILSQQVQDQTDAPLDPLLQARPQTGLDTKFSLSQNEIQFITQQYSHLKQQEEKLALISDTELAAFRQVQITAFKSEPSDQIIKLHMIALMLEYLKRITKVRPDRLQILDLLAFLYNTSSDRLAQVKLNEQGSAVISMLAVYMGLLGRNIDIITSIPLARANSVKYKCFYTAFGITCDVNANEEPNVSHSNTQVIYGSLKSFELAFLYGQIGLNNDMSSSVGHIQQDLAILQESDSLCIEDNFTKIYYPLKSDFAKNGFCSAVCEFIDNFTGDNLESNLLIHLGKLFPTLNINQNHLKPWVHFATGAKKLVRDKDYTLINGKISLNDNRHALPTYEPLKHRHRLLQFLQVRHQVCITQPKGIMARTSHSEHLKRYHRLFGLPHNLDTAIERTTLENLSQTVATLTTGSTAATHRDEKEQVSIKPVAEKTDQPMPQVVSDRQIKKEAPHAQKTMPPATTRLNHLCSSLQDLFFALPNNIRLNHLAQWGEVFSSIDHYIESTIKHFKITENIENEIEIQVWFQLLKTWSGSSLQTALERCPLSKNTFNGFPTHQIEYKLSQFLLEMLQKNSILSKLLVNPECLAYTRELLTVLSIDDTTTLLKQLLSIHFSSNNVITEAFKIAVEKIVTKKESVASFTQLLCHNSREAKNDKSSYPVSTFGTFFHFCKKSSETNLRKRLAENSASKYAGLSLQITKSQ